MPGRRAWVLCAVGALAACDGAAPTNDAGPTDAGLADAGPRALSVSLDGPAVGYVGEELCFTAVTTGPEVSAVTWIWGDGARERTDALAACHTYDLVGARVVGVTVESGADRADATSPLTVVFRPAAIRPTGSSPIAVAGDRAFVVNPDADTVAIIATDPPRLMDEIAVGDRPRTLAITGEVIAVACQGDASVHLLDLADGSPRGVVTLPTGSEPYGVVADPRGGGFYVTLRTGRIVSFGRDGAILDAVDVGPEPRGLAMNAEGALVATRWRSTLEAAAVYTVDASDPSALALVGATALPREVDRDSDTDNSGVLGFLNQLAPSPDGRRAILPGLKANVVTGLYRTGAPLTSQTTARAALGEVTFGAPDRAATDSFRHAFDDVDFASAAVFSPLGDRLYVAMQGAQTVVAVDPFDLFTIRSIDAVGEAPQGLALSEDGETLYVQAFLSRSVRIYDVSDLSRAPPLVAEVSTVTEEPLAAEVLEGKRVFYRSRDPRMSRTRYLSCASCHLDGEGDGLVWDFTQRGEGLRNTIELRGRAGRAPLHWSANFDEVQDFEHDIRDGQGGEGFLGDDVFHAGGRDEPLGAPKAGLSPELDALAAYVRSLDAIGASPHRDDPAAVARGEAIFEDPAVGCAGCHAGPERTDSGFDASGAPVLHDVGTLGAGSGSRLGEPLAGLDTPSLRGLWRTAPYLHDGSAATLREVLTARNPDDRHGVTSGLDAAAVDDLVAFLMSIE